MILNKIKTTVICISLFTAVGCTGDFEDINTNPYGAGSEILEQDFNNIKSLFPPMFNNVLVVNPEWYYQVQQGLQGDIWSGYMSTPTPFAGGSNNTTYNLVEGWNFYAWDAAYINIMANNLKIKQRAEEKYSQFYALSLIIKVQAMHRVTDMYGPCVYSQFGTENPVIAYDSQEEVYNEMFADLDYAVENLSARINANEPSTFVGTDLTAYNGDYTKWVIYANSLRLRLAMRLVKINPTLAKTQAEKAMAQEFGVMQTNDDSCVLVSPNYNNPIAVITSSWEDILMSADMESNMVGYKDPRLAAYFKTSVQFPGTYKGVRTGIEIAAKADHTGFSQIGDVVFTNKIVWMPAAEIYFLRAEGALRGWNMGGSAQSLYETGIATSFAQYSLPGANEYAANNVDMAKDYVDPTDATNNGVAVNKVTIAWDATSTNEVNLQRIITQKWIAGFPEGQEAWSEQRRTGYPVLLQVLKNTSGGKITTQYGVRRLEFAKSEKAGNPGGVVTGEAELGGPDTGGTRLWWDTTTPNF